MTGPHLAQRVRKLYVRAKRSIFTKPRKVRVSHHLGMG